MNAVPVFRGSVTSDGRLELDGYEAQRRRRYLQALAGKPVELTVRVRRSKRSIQQLRWIRGIAIPILAEHLGYMEHEYDALHYQCLIECYGTDYDPRFGRELPRVRHTGDQNTKETAQYMEWLVTWAAVEHGCVIPLPGESEAA